MKRQVLGVLAVSMLAVSMLVACPSSPRPPTSNAAPPSDAPIVVVDPDSRCPSPTTLALLDAKETTEILASDPIGAPPSWRGPDDPEDYANEKITAKSGRVFFIDSSGLPPDDVPRNSVVATEKGKEIWRSDDMPIAGGALFLELSPRETIVARSFSRGVMELFDAATGRSIGSVGNGAAISPDDRYVIDLPEVIFGVSQLTHPDVIAVALPSGKTKSIAEASPGDPRFSAAICATGATFALLRSDGELSVYRARDFSRVAQTHTALGGTPAFTRSGRYLYLVDDTKPVSAFELR